MPRVNQVRSSRSVVRALEGLDDVTPKTRRAAKPAAKATKPAAKATKPAAKKAVRKAVPKVKTVMKSETRYPVRNIKLQGGEVATLRFSLLRAKQMVKVSSAGRPDIIIERLDRKQFLAAPKGERPRLGATPGEAMQKAIKRYW